MTTPESKSIWFTISPLLLYHHFATIYSFSFLQSLRTAHSTFPSIPEDFPIRVLPEDNGDSHSRKCQRRKLQAWFRFHRPPLSSSHKSIPWPLRQKGISRTRSIDYMHLLGLTVPGIPVLFRIDCPLGTQSHNHLRKLCFHHQRRE